MKLFFNQLKSTPTTSVASAVSNIILKSNAINTIHAMSELNQHWCKQNHNKITQLVPGFIIII
jgi:hypothetical protein